MTKKEAQAQAREERRSVSNEVVSPSGPTAGAAPSAASGGSLQEGVGTPEPHENPLVLEISGLRYELDHAPSRKTGKKVVATVRLAATTAGPPLVDRLDLYSFRSRFAFATLVAESFGKAQEDVLGHLAVLLDQIERSHEEPKTVETVLLSPE